MQTKPNECYIKTLHNLPNSYGGDTNGGGPPWSVSPPTTFSHIGNCRIIFKQLLRDMNFIFTKMITLGIGAGGIFYNVPPGTPAYIYL